MKRRLAILILIACVWNLEASVSLASVVAQPAVETTRVSVASDGTEGNNVSRGPSISADGRYVAFVSDANNLVSGDTNDVRDIFVHDRGTGETTRVSEAADGTEGNDHSDATAISADGRYVAFHSKASNLVSGDTNNAWDIFIHDRVTGETTRVSIASEGTEGNDTSTSPSISSDGLYVAFHSSASNLVSGDTNGYRDVFVHDRITGETTRVSVASDGTEAYGYSWYPSISADGRYVAFSSDASNLVSGDTNDVRDIFVHDRGTSETTRVSVASDGTEWDFGSADPSISADGRYVVFESFASNLVSGDTTGLGLTDVFTHDRDTGETTLVSVASDGTEAYDSSWSPSISANGRYVVFGSSASNLVSGDTNDIDDVFVHDRGTGETTRVSVASDGTEGNDYSWRSSISADGCYVAFESLASNLVSGDTNNSRDVFVHDRFGGKPPTFWDVSPNHWAYEWIEAVYDSGITSGCSAGPPMYCPDATTIRAQVAVFLERGMHGSEYNPPPASGSVFDDVPTNHWAAAWIEQLAADGITGGCSLDPQLYCPESSVTRAQMAIFLERAMHWPTLYTPPPASGTVFDDVPVSHWAAAWIEQLAADGITGGCSASPPMYCPENPVTRAQMAVFLVRICNLPMP